MTDPDHSTQDDEKFSFAPAELREPAFPPAAPRKALRLTVTKHPPGGFDPYNSTGGFDRAKAWTRVRKR